MKDLCVDGSVGSWRGERILGGMEEVSFKRMRYKCGCGKWYDLNSGEKMKWLVVNGVVGSGELKWDEEYDFEFEDELIEREKYDGKGR